MQAVSQSPTPVHDRQILTLNDAAQLLGCSRRFLELEAARGRLTVIKLSGRLIRIRRSDLDAYLTRHQAAAV
jgi:excisionase family DNA binding protein